MSPLPTSNKSTKAAATPETRWACVIQTTNQLNLSYGFILSSHLSMQSSIKLAGKWIGSFWKHWGPFHMLSFWLCKALSAKETIELLKEDSIISLQEASITLWATSMAVSLSSGVLLSHQSGSLIGGIASGWRAWCTHGPRRSSQVSKVSRFTYTCKVTQAHQRASELLWSLDARQMILMIRKMILVKSRKKYLCSSS